MAYVKILGQPYKGEVGKIIDTVVYVQGNKLSKNALVKVKVFSAPYGLPEHFYYKRCELKKIPKHEALVRLL